MAFGLTPTGFNPRTLADVKEVLDAEFRAAFGTGINLRAPSRLGTAIGIFSGRVSEVWELGAALHAAFDPEQATGPALENLSVLTGTLRKAASPSIARAVALTGSPGTVIAADPPKVLSVLGSPDARFTLGADVTLDGGGAAVADFYGETNGPVPALAGTLAVIETPVAGWDTASNPTDAEPGTNDETDPELRTRRRVELRSQGAAATEAIRAAVLHVDDVTSCTVFENDTDDVNADGMPAHSVEVVVHGGADAAIAAAIFRTVAGGVQSHGTTTISVVDSEGVTHAIKFTRPAIVEVYVAIEVEKDPRIVPVENEPTFSLEVRDALLAFGDAAYQGGVDVVASRLYAPATALAGVLDVPELFIGTAPDPATAARIPITTRQIARLDSARITLTLSDGTP